MERASRVTLHAVAALALLAATGLVAPAAAFAAAPPAAAPSARVAAPKDAPVPPRAILKDVGPLEWNRRLDADRALAAVAPRWPVTRVLDLLGNESLFVFPARAEVPTLLEGWPRGTRGEREVRIFPGYRWILVLGPPDEETAAGDTAAGGAPLRTVHLYAANGTPLLSGTARGAPLPVGRDFILWPDSVSAAFESPTFQLRRVPSGEVRATWIAASGYAASAPLENFVAVNLVGCVDPSTGIRQDALRLVDLEGKELWTRPLRADHRDFAVSNFGEVAIARDRWLRVFDRAGNERFRASLPLNTVGRTAMGADGRFVLAATRAAGLGKSVGDLWVAVYDTKRKAALWNRRDLSDRRGAEPLELSISDDGERALVRLSSGSVLLLGKEGALVARFDLPRAAAGEYQAGVTPRRTWLSADGVLVALTTPVARSLGEALGSLYEVPRRARP